MEVYQDREISFMTDKTRKLLQEVSRRVLIVPTTTRTVEQYERIDLGLGIFPYALTCNGGILLVQGMLDEAWYNCSLERIKESRDELRKAEKILDKDENRCFELRNINKLFLFTKSTRPKETMEALAGQLDSRRVDILSNGMKVYVVPKKLTKGAAAARLKERLKGEKMIAAGDSEFDRSMLEFADIALAPQELEPEKESRDGWIRIEKTKLFSEGLLEYVVGLGIGKR